MHYRGRSDGAATACRTPRRSATSEPFTFEMDHCIDLFVRQRVAPCRHGVAPVHHDGPVIINIGIARDDRTVGQFRAEPTLSRCAVTGRAVRCVYLLAELDLAFNRCRLPRLIS